MATAARARREASGKGPPPYAVSGPALLFVPPKTSSRRQASDGLGGTASAASPDTAEGAPDRRLRRIAPALAKPARPPREDRHVPGFHFIIL